MEKVFHHRRAEAEKMVAEVKEDQTESFHDGIKAIVFEFVRSTNEWDLLTSNALALMNLLPTNVFYGVALRFCSYLMMISGRTSFPRLITKSSVIVFLKERKNVLMSSKQATAVWNYFSSSMVLDNHIKHTQ